MSTTSYPASGIKRVRATKDEVGQRRDTLLEIVAAMRPMTVRQVFYQATVRGIVEKTERGYDKVQNDLVLMRRAGVLPYEWLTDSTRWQRKPQTFNSVQRRWRKPLGSTGRIFGATLRRTLKFGWRRTR
jgi:hypothetical protein